MSAAETRKKILDAMFMLIAEQGYERASIGRIAELVEVKKAAIYYYYKKKEDILFDLIKSNISEISFDYSFYELSDYDEYKTFLIKFGHELIADYRDNVPLRKIITEINLLAQRNEEVKNNIIINFDGLISYIENFFKHGIDINVLSSSFDVKLKANLAILVFEGISNALVFNHKIDNEEVWTALVNMIL